MTNRIEGTKLIGNTAVMGLSGAIVGAAGAAAKRYLQINSLTKPAAVDYFAKSAQNSALIFMRKDIMLGAAKKYGKYGALIGAGAYLVSEGIKKLLK